MQTNPAVEQKKNIKWSESPWNQSGRKGMSILQVYAVLVCVLMHDLASVGIIFDDCF